MHSRDTNLVWLDLEMTGLDPESCAIIEAGVIITGPDLDIREEQGWVIWQPEEMLARMEPVVREMHTRNGLLEKVRSSTTSLRVAEREMMSLVAGHCGVHEGILAGNSIHTDRRFLAEYMPMLDRYLHYRMVDVTSLKVLARAWYPNLVEPRKPPSAHTALADLRASINELRYYREILFRATPG
ncbi:oligoribonuclease [Corallococcus sp. H22C18031201]|uniref:oligoribonuclease n=1 Tax=Citreicoccus inhibens TaxID=2849499 RepID=UPI000E746349|nr:oligoribonuclease [Citreicoccus inhibens]MBU8896773.1 oligoribonuclease [Citreicoccus inhibens]RJS21931.1 oligoribonuclease [Corallococcus sp. H22C18031201]